MSTSRFLLSGVLVLLGNASAVGQTSSSIPDCKQDAACQPLSQRAAERFGAEDFAEALRLFKLAYEVRADPRLLYNMARTLHKQGQPAAAATYYQQFLDSAVQDDAQRQKARDYLSQISPTPPTAPPYSNPEASAPQEPARTTDLGQRTGQPSLVERHRPPGASIGLMIGGAAALVIGLGCGGGALSVQNTVSDGGRYSAIDYQALISRGQALNDAAISLDVIGGLILAAGATWAIVDHVRARRAVSPSTAHHSILAFDF